MTNHIKLLDGAMGSMLIEQGETLPLDTWSSPINLSNPELIYNIHSQYIKSGSEYITTNTFRTTTRAYRKTGLSIKDSIKISQQSLLAAVSIAKRAAGNKAKVLGSIAPLEDCYKPELFPGAEIARTEYQKIGLTLYNAGVDGFILETMNSIIETITCLEVLEFFSLPIWVSFNLKNNKTIKSGETIKNTIKSLKPFPVKYILLNCNPLNRTRNGLKELIKHWDKPFGIYPNLGIGEPSSDGIIKAHQSDDKFILIIEEAIKMGATIVGGCCGTTPHHIGLIKKHFSI